MQSLLRLSCRAGRVHTTYFPPSPAICLHPRCFTTTSPVLKKSKKQMGYTEDVEEDTSNRKKSKSAQNKASSDPIVSGSQVILSSPESMAIYEKTAEKLKGTIDFFRRDCAQSETRATGRVTPSILDPVRVKGKKLEELATVGVRDGSTLVITLFEERNTKAVEQALYDSKLPNIIPQRQDARTIKIPIPKPTGELKQALYNAAAKKAEEFRVQCRNAIQQAVKKGGWKKYSEELDVFQKLEHDNTAEITKSLNDLKKAVGAK